MISADNKNGNIRVSIEQPKDKYDIDANAKCIVKITDELSALYSVLSDIYNEDILEEILAGAYIAYLKRAVK